MKKLFLIVFLGIGFVASKGQSVSAVGNTFDFSNVVVVDSISKPVLYHHAINWINNNLKGEKVVLVQNDSILGKVEGESSYLVYNQQASILKKISGRVSYKISIEVKDNKYRYHFSDFVFHYYKQDRTYNMVDAGKTKPMNEPKAAGWQKLWNSHRATVQNKMKEYCKQLEIKMVEKPATPEKVIDKKAEW